jgi:hypothetical protein
MPARSLLVILALTLPVASAQVEDAAAALLRCAAERHGGTRGALQTVQDTGSITYFGPGGAPAAILDVTTIIDYTNDRFRGTFSIGADIVLIQQLAGDEGFTFTPQTGTIPLPPSERAALRRVFVTGIAGIRLGDARDTATIIPDARLGDLRPHAIRLVTQGVEHTVFLAEDCTLIAETSIDPQIGEVSSFYADYRDVNGWWIPFSGEIFAGDVLFARVETQTVAIDEPLVERAFERP